MSCVGSSKPSAFGDPGQYTSCPAGSVLVGVDLAYDDPTNGARAGRIEQFGGHVADEGYHNNYYERFMSPPSEWQPGTVRGLAALYCASADAVAVAATGPPAATTKYPLLPALGGVATTFTCPAGQALTGGTAWVNGDGAEQIQFNCRMFAPNAPEGASSRMYPLARSPDSTAQEVVLSTLGAAPAVLFANGVAQGRKADVLANLGFGCQNYANAFDSSDTRKIACCAGTASNPQLCGGFLPQSAVCDGYMVRHCADSCAGGSCLDPACGCLVSPVGRPGCYDSRCADAPPAYRTTQMIQQAASCPTSASCDVWQALGKGQHLSDRTPAPADCAPLGPTPGSALSDPKMIIAIFVMLILLVLLAGNLGGHSRPPPLMFMPPPPNMF
jgi:hypothetical protein